MTEASRAEVAERRSEADADAERRLAELDDFLRFILQANRPSILEEGGFERIGTIAGHRFLDAKGVEQPYLTVPEAATLQISKGSLTPEERLEIAQTLRVALDRLRTLTGA